MSETYKQTVINNATQLTLTVFANKESPKRDEIIEVWDAFYEHILKKALDDKPVIANDITIVVYIDEKKGHQLSKYADIFEQSGFTKNKEGGYWKIMKLSELGALLQQYEWLSRAVKIRIELSTKKQEEGK